MTEFWEERFKSKQEMWGWKAADSVMLALALFKEAGLHDLLIPGFGYGRNAKVFIDNGFNVEGIEISKSAIEIAQKQFGDDLKCYLGSVGSMPFSDKVYDGIFCYALIHLLDAEARAKLVEDCYQQLKPGGLMVFVTISKRDFRYGQGKALSSDTFATWPGVNLFFYDQHSIESEFGHKGLIETREIEEPIEGAPDKPSQKFWYIVCRK